MQSEHFLKPLFLTALLALAGEALNAPTEVIALPSPSTDISDNVAVFSVLLREFDLNKDMQNGYAITAAEYEQLRAAWQGLQQTEKLQLLNGPARLLWTTSLVSAILNDLNDDKGNNNGGDYWQSPIETLVRGLGDCDDFTMAKYVSLRLLGMPPEQLRVGVMKYQHFGHHAVLLFFPLHEEDPWVLDNLAFLHRGFTYSHILRLSERMEHERMTPIWGVNEKFWSVFAEDLTEIRQISKPLQLWYKFSTALIHSRRVLLPMQDETMGETQSPGRVQSCTKKGRVNCPYALAFSS